MHASSFAGVQSGGGRRSARIGVWYALCALLFGVGAAFAQQPTDAQKSAVRAACRSDFMAQCSGVTPGGVEALTCLQQHDNSLSSACKKAVSAITTKPKSSSAAPAQSQPATPGAAPTAAQKSAVKSACRSDFMANCQGVTPGGAAALSCLQQNSAKLSPSCQQAVAAIGGAGAAAGSGVASAPAAGAAPRAMPVFTPRQELMIVRRNCGPDFRTLCRAVPLGGGRGIACLRENEARLSPGCQRVLASGL
jgi:hypothetical protein